MDVQHQLINYCLNSNGTIPDYVYTGIDGINGAYGVLNPNHTFPQDYKMIAVTKEPIASPIPDTILEIFTTKQELSDYMHSVLLEPVTVDENGNPIELQDYQLLSIDDHVQIVWDVYEKINNLQP